MSKALPELKKRARDSARLAGFWACCTGKSDMVCRLCTATGGARLVSISILMTLMTLIVLFADAARLSDLVSCPAT